MVSFAKTSFRPPSRRTVMWTTGCAVRSTGGLPGEGQTLEGGFEQTGLTTESRWGFEPVFLAASTPASPQ